MSDKKDTFDNINIKKDLDIGKNALTIKKKTYPKSNIRHVCEVDSSKTKAAFPSWALLVIIMCMITLFTTHEADLFATEQSAGITITIITILLVIACFKLLIWAISDKESYGLEIKLKSGETCHFKGDDEELIKEKQKAAKKLLGY
jgi:uncharacterized membrane protein